MRESGAAARACASAGAAATDTLDNGVTVAATCLMAGSGQRGGHLRGSLAASCDHSDATLFRAGALPVVH